MTEFFRNEKIRTACWRYPEYADFIKFERPEQIDAKRFTVVRTRAHILLNEEEKPYKVDIDVTVRDQAFTVYFLAITEFKRYDTECTLSGSLLQAQLRPFNTTIVFAWRLETHFFKLWSIIFTKSLPTFYHIKVTKELADCVQTGTRPSTVTPVVELCLPIEKEWMSYGLWNLRNRSIVMQVIENTKDFLPTSLNDIPSGWHRFLSEHELEHFFETTGEST
ncbi:hypothetical protein Clacol_008406 [Clathrus columnatus]|uniref:Uncharacterized protein n=1 Tax=Clathrus columnatus TaxID=1419009 RepID=A0AAV5AHM2_9AGAM|nr:hypothetical protein Clacol_008406 [Clathrus columnatus]